MAEFATKGVAGTGLGLGIAGTALGLLNGLGGGGTANGGIGGLLGGLLGTNQPPMGLADYAVLMGALGGGGGHCGTCAPVCNEDHTINRYELGLEQANAAKDSEIALLKANIYGDQKSLEMYKYIDGELRGIRETLGAQAVMNQKTADSFERVHDDLMCVKGDLEGKIAAERAARCCGDNAIVTYANATFYPKMVADVTVGTTTTAQTLYNPVANCGCGCGCNG